MRRAVQESEQIRQARNPLNILPDRRIRALPPAQVDRADSGRSRSEHVGGRVVAAFREQDVEKVEAALDELERVLGEPEYKGRYPE